jgi:hypothetical protein
MNQSWDDSGSSAAHCTSAVDAQVVVEDKCSMKEEPQEGKPSVLSMNLR